MNFDHLKALVSAAKSSEHLYEEQAAAMEFTLAYGEQLIAVVEAGQAMRDAYYTAKTAPGDNLDCDNAVGDWDEATKENV